MPNPVTREQTVQAVNDILPNLRPPGAPIPNLDTDALTNAAWSCNNLGPALLERVCANTGLPTGPTTEYARGANLPAAFADRTFVNIAMLGEPSVLNHNFNILVWGGTTYLVQAFVDHEVNIVRRFANAVFITNWHNLSDNVGWTAAYTALFGVAPGAVVVDPPVATWLTTQYVTF